MAVRSNTTWNRDDRDLLVELRTEMGSMRSDLAGARIEIKEINTGITARLLNLESNAVNKIQYNQLEDQVDKIRSIVDNYLSQLKVWRFIGTGGWGIILLAIGYYFFTK